jgi:biotin-(acetyl-CoA carboxylase) ligase
MTNVTITMDESVLKRARIRAIHEGTSVNAVLRAYLEAWANSSEPPGPGADIVALAERSKAGSGRGGRRWTRDDLHDR